MNFTPLSLKIKFLWSSENNRNISFCGKIVIFFPFLRLFFIYSQANNHTFFLISEIKIKRYIKMEYDQNFTPLSLKMNFLSSSENGRNFNIFADASNFGLEFCDYLKDDIAAESILLFCIIM